MSSLLAMAQAFHFLRPLWLLVLPLLWALCVWLARQRGREGDWTRVIDPALLPGLRLAAGGPVSGSTQGPWGWLALVWTLAVLALAGPAWDKDAAPAYRAPAGWVLVLDLSPSMTASDLTPNRVTRARYVLDDLLGAAHDVRVGLVAFGDDSYTVSPLTEDVATVRALLPPLAPDIMPTAGDKLTPALDRAAELLQTVASRDRRVLLLSDGFEDPAAALNAAAKLHSQGITLDVIGIGTADGAPAPTADGHFAQDTGGRARLARLDEGLLRQLAGAGGGRYASLAEVPGMINSLQTQARRFAGGAESASSSADGSEGNGNSDIRVQHWREGGIWLLPFVLMLTALLARRGWL